MLRMRDCQWAVMPCKQVKFTVVLEGCTAFFKVEK
jgi:hypothetical protein